MGDGRLEALWCGGFGKMRYEWGGVQAGSAAIRQVGNLRYFSLRHMEKSFDSGE